MRLDELRQDARVAPGALAASAVPAWRAARTDPARTLRDE